MAVSIKAGIVPKRGKLRAVKKRPASKKSEEYESAQYVRGKRDVPPGGIRMDRVIWNRERSRTCCAPRTRRSFGCWRTMAFCRSGMGSCASSAGKESSPHACAGAYQSTSAQPKLAAPTCFLTISIRSSRRAALTRGNLCRFKLLLFCFSWFERPRPNVERCLG